MSIKWLAIVPQVLERLPLERLFVHPMSNKQRLEELQEILEGSKSKRQTDDIPFPVESAPIHKVHLEQKAGELTTGETVLYQNREIGKLLLRMEGHCTQKFRLFGKICDCGAQKHLLDLESLCEETVPMVDNPGIYYEIIELGKDLAPKCSPEAVATLKYDQEFPSYARNYRDFRKRLIGNIDVTEMDIPESGDYTEEVQDG